MLTNVVSRVISEIAKERLVIYLGKNESAKLARLVNIAKGSDRSIREYARVSQVNVSTISRTINGEYTPGIKVLQKLTSPEAEPRGFRHVNGANEGISRRSDGTGGYV